MSENETECRIVGPYLPVGDTDWTCATHGVIAELRDLGRFGAADLRREDFYCPVGERGMDAAVLAATKAVAEWWETPVPGDPRNYIEVIVDAARPAIEKQYRDAYSARWAAIEPPEGWYVFGTHTNGGLDGLVMEFSVESGEDGLPLWERLSPEVTRDQIATEIETFRRAMPDEVPGRPGHDDMSWVLAQVRDWVMTGPGWETRTRPWTGEGS